MTIMIKTEAAMASLGAELAQNLQKGDIIGFRGDLGVGKSFLIRHIIRNFLKNPDETVPSPSFQLVQSYEFQGEFIFHLDLYRLSHSDELLELGFEDMMEQGRVLIEWPERLGELTPPEMVDIAIYDEGETQRRVEISGWKNYD